MGACLTVAAKVANLLTTSAPNLLGFWQALVRGRMVRRAMRKAAAVGLVGSPVRRGNRLARAPIEAVKLKMLRSAECYINERRLQQTCFFCLLQCDIPQSKFTKQCRRPVPTTENPCGRRMATTTPPRRMPIAMPCRLPVPRLLRGPAPTASRFRITTAPTLPGSATPTQGMSVPTPCRRRSGRQEAQHAQSAAWAVPQLGSCASSGRACSLGGSVLQGRSRPTDLPDTASGDRASGLQSRPFPRR